MKTTGLNFVIKWWLPFLFLALLNAWACKKETDSQPPDIMVTSPVPGSLFRLGESILLKVTFTENDHLDWVWVGINRLDGTPVPGEIRIVKPALPFYFEGDFPLTDSTLASGEYELQVQAFDGTNLTNAFVKVYIEGIETDLLYPLVVTRPAENFREIWIHDSITGWKYVAGSQGDYTGSAVSSHLRIVYLAGDNTAGISAYTLPRGDRLFTIPAENDPSGKGFRGLQYSFPLLYISSYKGYVRGYDQYGNARYYGEVQPAMHPKQVCRTHSLVISACHNTTETLWSLNSSFAESGYIIDIMPITFQVDALLAWKKDEILVFGTQEGDHKIWKYTPWQGDLTFLRETEGKTDKIIKLDEENLFIVSGEKISWYRPLTNSIIPFISMTSACQVAADRVHNELYTAVNDSIYRISLPYGKIISALKAPGMIEDIQLVFNKD